MIVSVILLLFLLLGIGLPVALALGLSGAVGLAMVGGIDLMLGMLASAPGSAITNYELLTIPMFLLMAEFMVASRISNSLFDAIACWTTRLRGGLGIATAITCAAFGAISGSSTASAATLSSSSVPSMISQGYEPRFAAGIVAISGTLAMIIPPSIAIILMSPPPIASWPNAFSPRIATTQRREYPTSAPSSACGHDTAPPANAKPNPSTVPPSENTETRSASPRWTGARLQARNSRSGSSGS